MLQIQTAAATHTGMVRSANEDAFITLPALAVVADGMGGHACGDVASALAVAAFAALGQDSPLGAEEVVTTVGRANEAIVAEADAHPEKSGMGTTVTGVALVDQGGAPHWLIFNVGDSRVYRYADQKLVQLTVDHSEVAELVASGLLSADGARTHPLRNVVTRSLGTSAAPVVDTWLVPLRSDDLFLACSDGLTQELDDPTIARLLAGAGDLDSAVHDLIDAAVAAGGHDNITAVIVAPPGDTAIPDEVTTSTIPRVESEDGAR